MLHLPDRFERLTEEGWDEARVRAGIREIAADAERAFDREQLWPADDRDVEGARLPLTNLYVGAAGLVWALAALRRRGHADVALDLADAAGTTLAAWRALPDVPANDLFPAERDSSLWLAESGILLVTWQLGPSRELADELYARVRANVENETNELMWGAPGTMLAARAMLDWTGEPRWADVWQASADELWRRRDSDGLWTQQLYGQTARLLGPPHGLVGNVLVLLQGGELLDADRREELVRDTADALARNAVVEKGLANWPVEGGQRDLVSSDSEIRLQWCHGAPGIVASAAPYLDEELLLAGAELTWLAGPHGAEKGAGLCHGTAGNGYALLKMFERTGDERWLERARRFAVHALDQVDCGRRERGRGRYSLWTGDVGPALFAADCLERRGAIPTIDTWN